MASFRSISLLLAQAFALSAPLFACSGSTETSGGDGDIAGDGDGDATGNGDGEGGTGGSVQMNGDGDEPVGSGGANDPGGMPGSGGSPTIEPSPEDKESQCELSMLWVTDGGFPSWFEDGHYLEVTEEVLQEIAAADQAADDLVRVSSSGGDHTHHFDMNQGTIEYLMEGNTITVATTGGPMQDADHSHNITLAYCD